MKKSELRQIIREEISKILQDRSDVSLNKEIINKHIQDWIRGDDNIINKKVPRYIFNYLKKKGYENKGTIYRALNIDPYIVIIKQTSPYIDLQKYIIDNNLNNPGEDEVIALLNPNMEVIVVGINEAHYDPKEYGTSEEKNPLTLSQLKTNPIIVSNEKLKEIRNYIFKKDKSHYISFTTNFKIAWELYVDGGEGLRFGDDDTPFIDKHKQ